MFILHYLYYSSDYDETLLSYWGLTSVYAKYQEERLQGGVGGYPANKFVQSF